MFYGITMIDSGLLNRLYKFEPFAEFDRMTLYEHQTRQFIGPSATALDGGRSHFARFR